MLPRPATACWSISRVFTATRRPASSGARPPGPSSSRSASGPRCVSASGRAPSSIVLTNRWPNVRGSTYRTSRPSSSEKTTCVCRARGSPAERASRSCPDIPRWITRAWDGASKPSRSTTRNLPTRRVSRTTCPCTATTNASGDGARRTARSRPTSTPTSVRPRRTASRSRRTTSTSGSSGIAVCRAVGREIRHELGVGCEADERRIGCADKREPRRARRGLLGLLLRPTLTLAVLGPADRDRREELLRVVRALGPHVVARQLVELARRVLLEPGLEVAPARALGALLDPLAEQPQHERARCLPPAVEVHRGDHGLHRVGEDRGLRPPTRRVLALAQRERGPDAHVHRDLGEHLGVHDRCPELRQLALGQLGIV